MKAAILAGVLLLVTVSLAEPPHSIPRELRRASRAGRAVGKASLLALLRGRDDAVCRGRTKSCRDCNSVNVCAYVGSGYTFIKTTQCPDSAPYCDDGACVQKPADSCDLPAVANDFTCYDGDEFQGYYPAPFDCTKYYVCANKVPYVYNCPEQHIYDHTKAACVPRSTNTGKCFAFPCTESAQYVLYKPDEAVYAYCVDAQTALVSKCPPNYRINVTQPDGPCKPYCKQEGRIADADSPNVYYECFYTYTYRDYNPNGCYGSGCTGGYYQDALSEPLKQFCPPSMVFDADASKCVLNKEAAAASPTNAPSSR